MLRWVYYTRGVGAARQSHVLGLHRVHDVSGKVVETPQGQRVAILAFADDVEGRDYGLLYITPAGMALGPAGVRADAVLTALREFMAEPNPTSLVFDLDAAVLAAGG